MTTPQQPQTPSPIPAPPLQQPPQMPSHYSTPRVRRSGRIVEIIAVTVIIIAVASMIFGGYWYATRPMSITEMQQTCALPEGSVHKDDKTRHDVLLLTGTAKDGGDEEYRAISCLIDKGRLPSDFKRSLIDTINGGWKTDMGKDTRGYRYVYGIQDTTNVITGQPEKLISLMITEL
ncbi:hypothetical protein [Bifidobacterium tissieri]|uniref:Uncharacterized protein n=1 Tax=Bifidobacterium tissieri TaxID=1630162 RepID=A0A5M9ZVC2_9BIFI|nr:hypothetical protein [Bifidobacterium tissieri]KAA8828643.1 hypothetical protein EM849_11440 [Bifidobacterium tissieri]KAA8831586.1 hypothetical protein EMO89_02355 [Bifidobacterium tissieri]